ncbi:MAG: tetratricopeptide repeat protein, partial [Longimicrobiales bacterium]
REVDELLTLAPDDIRLHQVRVEFAERSDDAELRLRSYLELARALERTNARQKAIAMYEHVLAIAPRNDEATTALARMKAPPAGDYVDLKALLDLDQPTGQTRYFVEEKAPTGDEDSDFASILSQFKAKLAEHVAPEDAGAHYDLGIAFKEMGLVDEAIAEFQVALRAGDGRLKIYEELGHCFLLKEQYTVATKVLGRGLEVPSSDEIERIGVYYHLGRAYEQLGRIAEARDAYERVMGLDITFRDVSERLASL